MSDTNKTPETATADLVAKTTAAAATAAAAAPAAAPKALKVGDAVRLRAVHGYIQNPFTLDPFETDGEKKVVADAWTVVQVEAGKLVVVE